jgi:alpha-beta hydrolase superfamily lysophospholipase|tara:strand:+ start:919 stop:1713 length:795 start_codon:yes stop_codon:yes gene_type:complete
MLLNIAFLISLLVLVSLLIFYFFQEKFIFRNGHRLCKNVPFQFSTPFDEVFLTTTDQQEINAVHFRLPSPKGVVLFFHGNKGNLTKWGERVNYFLEYKYEVFVIDYRSYGKSIGNFNENQMYEDALLAYAHLKNSFSEDKIVVYGFSLGSTFATKIAALNSPKELILEAPFYNLKKAVQFVLPFAPTFLLKFKFNTNKDIPLVTAPITIFHGNRDKTTSFEGAKALLKLNASSKNAFISIPEGTHHNIRTFPKYKQILTALLER